MHVLSVPEGHAHMYSASERDMHACTQRPRGTCTHVLSVGEGHVRMYSLSNKTYTKVYIMYVGTYLSLTLKEFNLLVD